MKIVGIVDLAPPFDMSTAATPISIIRALLDTFSKPGAYAETLVPITVYSESLSEYSVSSETLVDAK